MEFGLKYRAVSDLPHHIWGRSKAVEPAVLFWSMSAVEVNVCSSILKVDIESDYSLFENWIDIEIDGEVTQHFMLPTGRNTITVYRGMNPDHIRNVKIIRDTQAMHDDPDNYLAIHGFYSDGEYFEVKERPLRMEFIGDSLTTGEGLNGANNEMSWNPGSINISKSFPYDVSKALNAESRVISQSGWGVVASWDGQRDRNLPAVYKETAGLLTGPRAVKAGAREPNDFYTWKPDFIIINLGTNDCFSSSGVRPEELRKGVSSFLIKVRYLNPDAYILWAYGMLGSAGESLIKGGLSDFIELTGDQRTEYLPLPDTKPDEFGSREHPGVRSHRRAAHAICKRILKIENQ